MYKAALLRVVAPLGILETSNPSVGEIQAHLEMMQETWDALLPVMNDIEFKCKEEDHLEHVTERTEIEMSYLRIKSRFNDLANKHNPQLPVNPQIIIPNHSAQQTPPLPRIDLPQFSGSCTEWITFRDMFTALLHDKKELQSVQKV